VNEALLALFDRPRHEVLGKKFFDLAYSPDLVNKLDGQIQSVVATRQPVRDEIPFTAPSGNIRHFEYIFVPVLANDGTVEAVAGSTRDVTERRKVEQELRSANAELEEFAHVASHDMQEPLRMVNIYTQLLLKHFADATDKDIQGYAAFIREGVQHMTNLIRDLLSYSRTIHEEYERFPSADLVVPFSQALTVLRSRIAESGANISRDYLPKVLGNEAQLEQVFINLLANALKYVKPGMPACVHVSAARNGKEWIISVRDNGIGFDPQYAERIFGLFKRLHKNAYPGTGLGLAICKRIIERHGGRIWAESEIEKGSVFSFSLPSAAADETAEPK
jgi:PAS domain S-box-containing protein